VANLAEGLTPEPLSHAGTLAAAEAAAGDVARLLAAFCAEEGKNFHHQDTS
jgi:hypothetical protein